LRKKLSVFILILVLFSIHSYSQGNSPYSRYGLGDFFPNANIVSRAMGGLTAAVRDSFGLMINFDNPASYSTFTTNVEPKSKRSVSGRVILDVGLNLDNLTLHEENPTRKFASSNAYFSYVQVGLPIKRNWGVNFGLRQLSNIGYSIVSPAKPPIDTIQSSYTGNGGLFLASAGTGIAFGHLSVGFNVGYAFGKKENSTKLDFFTGDSAAYLSSNHTTRSSFGNIVFLAGAQYNLLLQNHFAIVLGIRGNLKQNLNAQQDVVRETFYRAATGDVRIDSVYENLGVKGKVVYPASYAAGFTLEKRADLVNRKYANWSVGLEYTATSWNQYRFFGATDLVQNNWQLKLGGQVRPEPSLAFFSRMSYRAGFFIGSDYIKIGSDLPVVGVTFGMGVPVGNFNRQAPGQFSILNLAFEYEKRGNKSNLLRDNLFRISVGFSLTDLWFGKHRYD
jgi:hypothetical protein